MESGDCGGTDQRALIATSNGCEPNTSAVVELTDPVHLDLCCVEERGPETQGNGTTNEATLEIEQIDDRADRSTNQAARPLDLGSVSLASVVPCSKCDPSAGSFTLEHPLHMPWERLPIGFDDDVADVTGISVGAGQQPAVHHDASPDAGRYDHCEVVRTANSGTHPALGQCQCLRVVVQSDCQPREFSNPEMTQVSPMAVLKMGAVSRSSL